MKSAVKTIDVSNPDLYNDYVLENDLHNFRKRFLLMFGGRGGAKSKEEVQKSVIELMTLPFHRIVLVRKVYDTIKDSIFAEFVDQIDEWNLRQFFHITTSPLYIKCKLTNNVVLCRGMDKPSKIKSLKDPTKFILEEADENPYEAFGMINGSLRTPKAVYLQMVLLFNTSSKQHWIYKRFIKGRVFQTGKLLTYDNVGLIHLTHKQNNFLPDSFHEEMEDLKNHDYTAYRLDALGEFLETNDDRCIVTIDAVDDLPYNSYILPTRKNENLYMSADIAALGQDKFVISIRDGLCFIHISIFDVIDHDEIIAEIKKLEKRYQIRRSHIIYDATGEGAFVGAYLKGAFAFQGSLAAIERTGENKTYFNLRSQAFFELARLINNREVYFLPEVQNTAFVHNGEKSTIMEEIKKELKAILQVLSSSKLRVCGKLKMKEILQRSPDLIDTISMSVVYEMADIKELQKKFGYKSSSKRSRLI